MNQANSSRHLAFINALEQLEAVMQKDGVWPDEVPNDQALKNAIGSEVPFAADCFSFEAWLAFVFIPKMRHFIEPIAPYTGDANYTRSRSIFITRESKYSVRAKKY